MVFKLSTIFNSNVAIVLGVLFILGMVQNPFYLIVGLIIVFSALACKSAKSRKTKPSTIKFILEIVAMGFIFLAITLQKDFINLAYENPVLNIIIPAWAILAYLYVASKK